ncbi:MULTISPECIES: Tat pathway signal protein [Hyphobacterium]|uniref:Tat pathway signal protein n=1 Tax=Hyphobacterium vulgare TaxID=1736751 RepID=A0ABV6ZXJ2_9PROT
MTIRQLLPAALALILAEAAPAFASPPPSDGDGHGAAPQQAQRGRSITSSPDFVPLAPLTATLQADYRLRGILQIEAGLEIPDRRLRARAEEMMPRLRNAYVTQLSIYAGANYRYGEMPDADRISAMLQQATDDILGQEGAQILLGMVVIHER